MKSDYKRNRPTIHDELEEKELMQRCREEAVGMRNADGTYNEVLFTAREVKPEDQPSGNDKIEKKPATTIKTKRNNKGKANSLSMTFQAKSLPKKQNIMLNMKPNIDQNDTWEKKDILGGMYNSILSQ